MQYSNNFLCNCSRHRREHTVCYLEPENNDRFTGLGKQNTVRRGIVVTLLFLFLFFILKQVQADTSFIERKDVRQFIQQMVHSYGFNQAELKDILSQAKLNPHIIESMNKPYEKKSWDVYQAIFLTPERVKKGVAFWQANFAILKRAEQTFHVPAYIIVAILGVETMYGERQGNYKVLDALTTLAFDYPKRGAFFKKELKEFLLLSREQGVSPHRYVGSYAGAIGTPQFMPSSYRYYAVDFSGDGKKDLMTNHEDIIGSVAHYLHKHGWVMNAPVAQPALVKGAGYKQINLNARHANYTLKQLADLGVKPEDPLKNTPPKAGLIELMTNQGEEYWLTYPNFYVITRYNTSPQYALAVYLLARQLHALWMLQQSKPVSPIG